MDYSSIISINAFRDVNTPRVSITTSERLIEGGQVEHRVYWITLRTVADLEGFMDFVWLGKRTQPAASVPAGL